jgi:hypothetical protein
VPPVKLEESKRILAHITSDKPIYKPNDMAFFEVYTIDPTTKAPAHLTYNRYNYKNKTYSLQDTKVVANMKILDSFDSEVFSSPSSSAQNGTIAFTYKVPKDAKGGEYKIKVTSS